MQPIRLRTTGPGGPTGQGNQFRPNRGGFAGRGRGAFRSNQSRAPVNPNARAEPKGRNDEFAVELTSNCYRIHSKEDLVSSLFQYEIAIWLCYTAGGTARGDLLLPNYIKHMVDRQKIIKSLRRKIVATFTSNLLSRLEVDGENNNNSKYIACDHSCFKLLANFDLHAEGGLQDIENIEVPYCRANVEQKLEFAVQLKRIRIDDLRTLLNIVLGVDGRVDCSSHHLVHQQAATQTVTYNTREPIASKVLFGLRLLRGQTVAAKSIVLGPAMTISNTTSLFYEPVDGSQSMLDYLKRRFRVINLSEDMKDFLVQHISKNLSGREAEVSYETLFGVPRRRRICSVGGTANDPLDAESKMTIREYFLENHGISLRYPNLPCIVFDMQGRVRVPMELCHLAAGERVGRQLNRLEQSEVTQKSTILPTPYFNQVETRAKQIVANKQVGLDKIGVTIDPQPLKVSARVLAPICLRGAGTWTIYPRNGRYDASKTRFLRPVSISRFSVTLIGFLQEAFDDIKSIPATGIDKFVNEYCLVGQSKGVKVNAAMADVKIIFDLKEKVLREKLTLHVKELNESSVDLAIMVLPSNSDQLYSQIQFLETQFKFADQTRPGRRTHLSCLQMDNLMDMCKEENPSKNNAFLQNMWLKHNSELGGVNYVLKSNNLFELPGAELLILGVDVCHPARGDSLSTSMAAVVGLWSIAGDNYSHSVQMRAQPARQDNRKSTVEKVVEIGSMVEQILASYARRMEGKLPTKILVLRGGVSDGQFAMVEEYELAKIRQALALVYTRLNQPDPKVSCFVVQKRHDVRFRLSEPLNVDKRDAHQLHSGTIVDEQIVSPYRFSYYTAPQECTLGTARAPFVSKLADEIGLTDNEYQRLILALCYLSPRCTMTTSVPTPIDLADLAAERCKLVAVEWAKANGRAQSSDHIDSLNQYLANLGSDYLDKMFYV